MVCRHANIKRLEKFHRRGISQLSIRYMGTEGCRDINYKRWQELAGAYRQGYSVWEIISEINWKEKRLVGGAKDRVKNHL
jgi:hypothetical protein